MPHRPPLRALFLAHSFPRYVGDAAGSFLLRLATALRAESVEVHVVAPAAPGFPAAERLDGVAVERFRYAPRRLETLAYAGTMVREARRTGGLVLASFLAAQYAATVRARRRVRPHVVHAHWWFPSGLVAVTPGARGLPLVVTSHGTDIRLARDTRVARLALRRVTRRAAAVTTVSRWLAGELRALDPAIEPAVIPMPVATELFVPDPVAGRDRLLFVGRLSVQKGIEHLVRALALTRCPVGLDVVGEGPLREELTRLAAELRVEARIRWIRVVRQPELVPLYQAAAAVVVPSIDEGLGMVAVEAALCETPVIASASGGLTDVVRHEETGLLVPPGDPAALACAIDSLLDRHDRGAALARAARRHALTSFSPSLVAGRYAELYRRVRGDHAP